MSQSTTGIITLTTTLYKTTIFFTSRNSTTWTLFVRPRADHVHALIINSVKLALKPTFWDYENDPAFAATSIDSQVPPPKLT